MQFLSYLVNGISLGSIYAVIALGYTMVYGIARMLNFAHGDVIMVGGYVAFVMMTSLGLPALAAICAAVVVCTLLGVAIERVAYKPLREAPSLAVLITAIGMSYLLQNLALLIWGSAPKTSQRPFHRSQDRAGNCGSKFSFSLRPPTLSLASACPVCPQGGQAVR